MFYAKRELLSQCLPEVQPFFDDHWRELARNQDKIKLNPKYDSYLAMESAGSYRAYVARTDDGEVAGYAGFVIHRHLHYQDHTWALSDLFFVRPEFRRKFNVVDWLLSVPKPPGAGTVLFQAAETDLRKLGVSVIHATAKLANPAAIKMLTRKMGYIKIEMGMAKVLK